MNTKDAPKGAPACIQCGTSAGILGKIDDGVWICKDQVACHDRAAGVDRCVVCGVEAGGIGGLVRSADGQLVCSRVDHCDERRNKRVREGIGATLRTIDTLSAADLQLRAHELRREAGELRRSSRELEAQAVRLETMADELRQLKLWPAGVA